MKPILQRVLMAYRPLGLRGLLMDGQYRWPAADVSNDRPETVPPIRPHRRMLLAALTGQFHNNFSRQDKP